jgi:hypothetical protein
MRLGCVVRVESIGQDLTTSLWDKSCQGGATWASPVRGTCGGCMCDEQILGGVSSWDEASGWRCRQGMGCLLTLRGDILSGPPKDWYVLRTGYPVRSPYVHATHS